MLNDSQRRALAAIGEQVDAGMDLLERLQRVHLATSPSANMPLDTATFNMLEGYVFGPVRMGVRSLLESGVRDEALTAALSNLGGHSGASAVIRYLLALGCLRAAIAGMLRDQEATIESAVEVAFAHLQRLLVVDDGTRDRWLAAFEKNEVACERLGGVHLLQHGLWGFKTDATGERSDLVLGEHVSEIGVGSLQAARGLILTEWKRFTRASTDAGIAATLEQARRQLARYVSGSLAAMELRRARYVVVVSRTRLPAFQDVSVEGFVVRHINIAIDPETPSRE